MEVDSGTPPSLGSIKITPGAFPPGFESLFKYVIHSGQEAAAIYNIEKRLARTRIYGTITDSDSSV